jgi:hypothetical protein
MRVLFAGWRWRQARLPTILAERDLLVQLRAQPERTRGSSRDAGSPVAQPVPRMVRAPTRQRKASDTINRSIDRSAGRNGTHTSSDVEELLLRIRGLIFARAILEQRDASEDELKEHRLEIERLRWRLASLMRDNPADSDTAA